MKMPSEKRLSRGLRRFLFIAVFFTVSAAHSQPLIDPMALTTMPVVETRDMNSGLSFSSGYTSLNSDTGSISGLDFSLRYHFSLRPEWAVAAEASQGLNTSGFNTLYTALSAMALYARGGDLTRAEKVTKIGNQTVTTTRNYTKTGWVFQGGIKQYFFNATNSVFPVIGPTAGGYYQFGSSQTLTLHAGATFDMGKNADRTLTAVKVFVGAIGFK